MGNDFSDSRPDPLVLELIPSNPSISHYHDDIVSGGPLARDSGNLRPPSTVRRPSYLSDAHLRIYAGAAPLDPLRTRDLAVLEDWFDPDCMPEIEADILYNLLLRFPEPCWEDSVFGFLGEFL